MKVKLSTAFWVLAAMLMTSCVLLDVRSGYELSPTTGKGILSVGLTAEDDMPNFVWHVRKVGEKESQEITFWTARRSAPLKRDR